ncbi:hypothetical protein ABT120_45500 [Nonomuraea angiospora]|uniref:hypothetical protein n=1 Tax=Nonomuraea angiospora TaxID=46172 RepID=UPI00332C5DA7
MDRVPADVLAGLEPAQRIPSGIVHIHDQIVNDEANAPFGGVRTYDTGSRYGSAEADIEAFTEDPLDRPVLPLNR